ncbi:MAG TPA: DNA replication and repair protein RecF, partial [Ruminococcus bromii]|nr:DNA replication and repair protein RecF [Ruminococcus bromii]
DIRTGFTNYGPHRDDIEIIINGKNARAFASQGQQRSAVLSLKLAEASVLRERMGEEPVILLDDVLSELDAKRQDFLLNELHGCQVFITCCEKSNKEQLKDGKIFLLNNGEVS